MAPTRLLVTPVARLLAFAAGTAASIVIAVAVAGWAAAALGVSRQDVIMALAGGALDVPLLFLSAALLRCEGASLAALGVLPSGRRARAFGLGFAVSAAAFLGVAAVQSAAVGAAWQFQGAPGV